MLCESGVVWCNLVEMVIVVDTIALSSGTSVAWNVAYTVDNTEGTRTP